MDGRIGLDFRVSILVTFDFALGVQCLVLLRRLMFDCGKHA